MCGLHLQLLVVWILLFAYPDLFEAAENWTKLVIPDFEFDSDGDLNNTRVSLNISCEPTEVIIDLSFEEPFVGRFLLENDAHARGCSFVGNGSSHYRFDIPLLSCGTKRIGFNYTNSLMILYDQRQVMEMGDQRKVILCQYPVPVAPPFLEIRRNAAGSGEATSSVNGNASDRLWSVILFACIWTAVKLQAGISR